MEEEKILKQAQTEYGIMCNALDAMELEYEKNESELSVNFSVTGNDLPVSVRMIIESETMRIILLSQLPLTVAEEKRIDFALAVSYVNNMFAFGCFDFDISDGSMVFRITNSYCDSIMSETVFQAMVALTVQTVDEYNDKFMMMSLGYLTADAFIAEIKAKRGE